MTVQCEWFLLCSADACPAQNRQVGDMPRGIIAVCKKVGRGAEFG